jgi:hypothetical protein
LTETASCGSQFVNRSIHIERSDIVADYDVQYDRDSGDWGAKRAGAEKAAGRYETQADAHDAARGFAERSCGGEVRDHRKDNNQIRNTDTVGKKDPYPPKG